ncbi:MAG: hypothetical protein J6B76_07020 [Peptococcaceae bacterium]|nr:hypothetical protein [Peptococcaceae bacterium]
MKNKKLFAILTLVCFMFTLMPVAAFAAVNGQVTVDGKETAPVYVNQPFAATAGEGNFVYFVTDEEGKGVATSVNGANLVVTAEGKYEVVAVKYEDAESVAYKIVTDYKMLPGEKVQLLNLNCKSDFVKGTAEVKAKVAKVDYVIDVTTVANFVEAADANTPKGYEYEVFGIEPNNGFLAEEINLALYIAKADGSADTDKPVKNAEITFSTNSGYVSVVADKTTDKNGKADFAIVATKTGNYKVTAQYGKAVVDFYVHVNLADLASVTTVVAPKAPVALDSFVGQSGIVFKLADTNGDAIKGTDGNVYSDAAALDVTVVDAPVDAALADEDVALTLQWSNKAQGWILSGTDKFDEEGEYTFKVALENGASATASVTIKEFGKPVSMTLTYNETNIGIDGKATVKEVKLVDANGVTKDITNDPKFNIEYVANDLAVETVEADGTIEIKDAANQALKLIGTKVSAMAIVDTLDLVATAELTIVNDAVALEYAKTTADVAVNNTLFVNTVDADGNKVDIADLTTASVYVYVLDAPANAKYAVNGSPYDTNKVAVSLTASAAGEYKLQTVVKYGANKYLSSVDTIVVGGTVSTFDNIAVVSIGTDKMIVNNETVALDVAPYIENNRTMMQYNVLGAFGFDIQWVQETRSVVAEGNGIKVVMNIDSKVATVNGEEVTLDVAPTIVNGRTIVPVGFITGTFGITPNFTYNADGSIADILFTK